MEQPPAGQHVEPAQDLADTGKQRVAGPLVEVAGAAGDGTVAHLLVAVGHEPIEQLGESDRAARRRLAFECLPKGGIQTGGVGQVVAITAQHQVANRAEAGIAAFGQERHQLADELPPMAKSRPGQVGERLGQLRVGIWLMCELDDGRDGQQLERRFPEVKGRQMPFQGGLGVVCPAIELRQRQRQAAEQLFVEWADRGHDYLAPRNQAT